MQTATAMRQTYLPDKLQHFIDTTLLVLQEKAVKLHEQLHGSTFHIKLAKEAMKKVREAEAAVQAKLAEEAEALRQGMTRLS